MAFVNSIVYFSKKSFTENLTHNDVISGDFILFYNKKKPKQKTTIINIYNNKTIITGLV